jgi:SAM-dependent methyltransferase
MSDIVHRSCPVCGGDGRRLLHRQRFLDGPMGNGYDVVVCTHCGGGFADGIPSQTEMDRYYTGQSKYTYDHANGAESEWDLKRFEAIVDQIDPHLRSHDISILDIGCATGGLLSVFKKRGFKKVMGVDPSPICAAVAGRLYSLTVRTATLSQLGNWNEGFDLILMVGVLEHISEIKAEVRAASQLLNPGGLLYCAVPDVEGLADCPNAPYQQFSIEHVNFFSINTLGRLMEECGLAEGQRWNWTIEWRQGVWEPIASGLYQRGNRSKSLYDTTTEPALIRYLAFSEKGDRKILSTVAPLIANQEPIFVWGAGTLARRLMANTAFGQINILAFVDANPHIQGQELAGRPILKPTDLVGRIEPILVCSFSFAVEISTAVRHQYGLPNRILSLAGEAAS